MRGVSADNDVGLAMNDRQDIIYLVHRLPYPPNKGDKIRSYHLLCHLLDRYNVHLGCFVDDDADSVFVPEVRKMCKSLYVGNINPALARIGSLRGLLTGEPLSIPYYRNGGMAKWVRHTMQQNAVAAIVGFSSPTAQFVLGAEYSHLTRLMDLVDIDSDKWRQYADKTSGPMRWIYRREAERLLDFEQQIAREFDGVMLVSDNESDMFRNQVGAFADKIYTVCNGVDVGYFDPAGHFENPFPDGALPLVFTGMMDYWPNVDAMSWFAREILPAVRAKNGDAGLWVVGASPTREVQSLAELAGVTVTGKVPDVRPYLKHAALVVAPLRIARGVQNKVLEALAMERSVVSTSQAAAGLSNRSEAPLTIADDADTFAAAVIAALNTDAVTKGGATPRQYVLDNYDWTRNLSLVDQLLSGESVR